MSKAAMTATVGVMGAGAAYLLMGAAGVTYRPVRIAASLFTGIVAAGWHHNREEEKPPPPPVRLPIKGVDLTKDVADAATKFTLHYKGCDKESLTSLQLAMKSIGVNKLFDAPAKYDIGEHLKAGVPLIVQIGKADFLLVKMAGEKVWLADPSAMDPKRALVEKTKGEMELYLTTPSGPVNLVAQLNKYKDGYVLANAFDHYHYDCDEIKDNGWGCAYRAIQGIAAAHGKKIGMQEVRDASGKDGSIDDHEWLEPEHGFKVMQDKFEIGGRLVLWKEDGDPEDKEPYTGKMTGHDALSAALKAHFEKFKTPVMVDDGRFAMLIVGVAGSKYVVADTHVTDPKQAVYQLDEKGARDRKDLQTMTPKKFFSSKKSLMLYFPEPKAE